ncbi:MAG TPA: hypothetical protein VFX30_14100 [bacterium]|nr:hypothetical protein [bacterium]
MPTRFVRVAKAALAGLFFAVMFAGHAFGQKTPLATPERMSQIEQMQISEEPKAANVGIEVTGMSETVLMSGDNPNSAWARQYSDAPLHQLIVVGRHAVVYTGWTQQPPPQDAFELILLAEDSKDLDACRDMAANALTRSTSANLLGTAPPRPLLFHMYSDKAFVRSIYNPWKSTRVTVTLKPRDPENMPQFVSCYLWSGDIWGIP